MSTDISYVLKVVDDFSANLRKFQSGIAGVESQADKAAGSLNKVQKASKFFTQNLVDLGKAAGIYEGFRTIKNFATDIFQTRVQMDSLNASLTAIMPKFDGTKSGTQLAAEEIEYLKSVTEKFGLSFKESLPNYMQFLASSKQDLGTTRRTFEAFAGISRMYGLSSMRFGLVINALNQMQSKGVVSMEELRQQLGESLPGAIDLFAESLGVSSAQFMKLVGEGRVGAGALKKVAETIEQKYGKDMVAASKTLGAETERLSNSWLFFKDTLSKGVAPVMASSIGGLTDMLRMLRAVGDQNTFVKLDSDGQSVVITLRIIRDLVVATAEGLKNISKIGFGILGLGRDAVSTLTIGSYQAYGLAEAATGFINPWGSYKDGWNKVQTGGEAFGELANRRREQYNETQKVEVNINHNNVPAGTTMSVQTPRSGKVNVGTVTNYE